MNTIVCDRESDGAGLRDAIVDGSFEAVVDYYAMEPRHVEDVIDAFEDPASSLSHYIFVSTNMVVRHCQPFSVEAEPVQHDSWCLPDCSTLVALVLISQSALLGGHG